MGVLIIGGISALGVAFMLIFLVNVCREGSRIRVCEIMKLDAEPIGSSHPIPIGVEEVQQDESADRVPAADMKVVPLRSARHPSRSVDRRSRKPA